MIDVGDWDLISWEEAVFMARVRSRVTTRLHLPVDRGPGVAPRFGTVEAPRVGDFVSKGFNGDYYPVGTIRRVSDPVGGCYRVEVERDDGSGVAVFYRRKQTSTWVMQGGTWMMVMGHYDRRNPEL